MDDPTLRGFLDAIGAHSVAFANLDSTDARAILEDRGDMRTNAMSQALAAWLNWANDGTTFYEEIQPGLRFGDLIDQVEAILADPAADQATLEAAKDLAESVNVRR